MSIPGSFPQLIKTYTLIDGTVIINLNANETVILSTSNDLVLEAIFLIGDAIVKRVVYIYDRGWSYNAVTSVESDRYFGEDIDQMFVLFFDTTQNGIEYEYQISGKLSNGIPDIRSGTVVLDRSRQIVGRTDPPITQQLIEQDNVVPQLFSLSLNGAQLLAYESKVSSQIFSPIIRAITQTDLDGNNSGEVLFYVYDTVYYNTTYPCMDTNPCVDIISYKDNKSVKETRFSLYPDLISVVYGRGCSLLEKTQFIQDKYCIPGDSGTFMGRIISYGITRYILSGLIYGTFDVKWLLQKYTCKFFDDLRESKFSKFVNVFYDPFIQGMNLYYKRC